MARGRLLSTKRREAYWLAKEEERGRQQAKIEAWKKTPLDMKLWELIKDKVDPVKLASAVAFTPIVKMAIDAGPTALEMYQNLILIGSPLAGLLFKKTIDPKDLTEKLKQNDLYIWIISFGLAYLIVENFDAIVATGKTVGGWVANLFSIAPV